MERLADGSSAYTVCALTQFAPNIHLNLNYSDLISVVWLTDWKKTDRGLESVETIT